MIQKGMHCEFDTVTGIKTFKEEEVWDTDIPSEVVCDFAYNAQKAAYLVGAAPEVFERVSPTQYRTDIADTSFFMTHFLKHTATGERARYNKVFPELEAKLIPIMKDNPIGHSGVDLIRENLGLYRGRVVMIDFS